MTDGLTIEVVPEGDGSAELRVSARSKGFAGTSSAWFPIERLVSFAKALAAYPLKEAANLAGGFWNRSGDHLEQTHVSISAYPTDRVGTLALKVLLAEPLSEGDRRDSAHKVELELKTSYAKLEQFAKELEKASSLPGKTKVEFTAE